MPIMGNHRIMLQRNLIYSGVPRARQLMVIVGTQKALSRAVRNMVVKKRNTLLQERLRDPNNYCA